jgi:hypothetical protein
MVEKVVILVRVAFTFVAIYDGETYIKLHQTSRAETAPNLITTNTPTTSTMRRIWSAITPSRQRAASSPVVTCSHGLRTRITPNDEHVCAHCERSMVAGVLYKGCRTCCVSYCTKCLPDRQPTTPHQLTPPTPVDSSSRLTADSVQDSLRTNLMHWIVFALFLCVQVTVCFCTSTFLSLSLSLSLSLPPPNTIALHFANMKI